MPASDNQLTFALPDGLKVVLVQRPFGKGFTAFLNLRVGRHNDPPHALGLAHLCEHLAFTEPVRSLSRELSDRSVQVNATTSQQRTEFHVSGHQDYLQEGLRLLSRILEDGEIDSQACRHEREIVYQELVDQEPSSLCERTTAIWKHGYRLSGDPNWRSDYQQRMQSVRQITSKEVNAFRNAFYRPDQAALAIVAPGDTVSLQHLVEELFGSLVPQEPEPTKLVEPADASEMPQFDFYFDRWPNIWLYVTNTVPDSKVSTRLAADILSHQLGGGEHSEMYKRFRDETTDAYQATADFHSWIDRTSVTGFISVNKKAAPDALRFLVERVQRFANEGINQQQRADLIERKGRWWDMRMENHYEFADYLSFEALRPEGSSMVDLHPDSELWHTVTTEQLSAATRTAN